MFGTPPLPPTVTTEDGCMSCSLDGILLNRGREKGQKTSGRGKWILAADAHAGKRPARGPMKAKKQPWPLSKEKKRRGKKWE